MILVAVEIDETSLKRKKKFSISTYVECLRIPISRI